MFSRQKQLSGHGRDQLENNKEKQELNTFYLTWIFYELEISIA